jgi:hypothetical protein
MLLEQRIEKFFSAAEARSPEPSESVSQIDHATARSKIENAKRTGHFKSL